jgi:hypothetical protein
MDDATPVYFFQSGDTNRYAMSIDVTGCNMPMAEQPWLLRGEIRAHQWPEDLAAPLAHVAAYGFSLLNCIDEDAH